MQVTFLVTDGGPHPADKWASLIGERIAGLIEIDAKSDSPEAALARKAKPRFALDIADAIEGQLTILATAEVGRIGSGDTKSRNDPFDVDGPTTAALASVVATADGTPFALHFQTPVVQAAVGRIIKQHFIDAANNQRSWQFDQKGL